MKSVKMNLALAFVNESVLGASTLGDNMPKGTQVIGRFYHPFDVDAGEEDTDADPLGVETDKGVKWSFSAFFNSKIDGQPIWKQFTNGKSLTEAKSEDNDDDIANLIGMSFSLDTVLPRMRGALPHCTPASYEGRKAYLVAGTEDQYDFSNLDRKAWRDLRSTPLITAEARPMYYYELDKV